MPKVPSRQPRKTEEVPSFTDIESRVFTSQGGSIFVGTEKVTEALRSTLRDEAEYIANSRLWEVLNASVVNESYRLALIQSGGSGDVEKDVQFAKALHHWGHFMRNVIHILRQK